MKKILNLMIAAVCVLSSAFIFSGCNMFHKDHKASDEWTMNSTHHWHECTDCGDKVDKAEHDWNETILIEATQTEEGLKYYTCKDCGIQRAEEYSITTVTEDVWGTALNLTGINNYVMHIKSELSDGTIIQSGTITKDGDIFCVDVTYDSDNGYFSKEGEKYYYYEEVSETWTKTEITQENYEDHALANFEVLVYSDFTYDDELKGYVGSIDSTSFQLYFESGKLIKLVMLVDIDESGMQSISIEYVDTELELPVVN